MMSPQEQHSVDTTLAVAGGGPAAVTAGGAPPVEGGWDPAAAGERADPGPKGGNRPGVVLRGSEAAAATTAIAADAGGSTYKQGKSNNLMK